MRWSSHPPKQASPFGTLPGGSVGPKCRYRSTKTNSESSPKSSTATSNVTAAKPADYVIDLLGPHHSELPDRALTPERWDTAATAIETRRHRSGITPFDGPFEGNTPFERVVGTITDAIDALTIGPAIDAHLDGPEHSISYGH